MSSAYIPVSLQRRVRERSGYRCEYCRLSQARQHATFHVDHIWPRIESGATVLQNLALACVSCSLRKGSRTVAPDPETTELVHLFNPRTDAWTEHFELASDFLIIGTTPIGRATVAALRLNHALAVEIRREEADRGRYP
jgi:5-methylcytosine-specific restriction endonuclease McrA